MAKSWQDYTYEPHPLTRKPSRQTGYDQTNLRPSSDRGTGKLGGVGARVTGGNMNGGGKRRPAHDTRKGID